MIPGFFAAGANGGAAPSLWLPSDLAAPPAAWYDDQSPVTTFSGEISQWDDRSSNAFHLTCISTRRPTPIAGGLNGLDTVRFNGTLSSAGEKMFNTSTGAKDLLRNVGGGWIFSVYDKLAADATDTTRVIARIEGSASADIRAQLQAGASAAGFKNVPSVNAQITNGGTTTRVSSTAGARTTWVMVLANIDYSGNVLSLYIDGNAADTGAIAGSGGTSSNTASVSGLYVGGQASADNANGDVEIAALLIGSGAILGSTDIDKMFGCYAHRYGLEGNLPGGHPYKSAAPTV